MCKNINLAFFQRNWILVISTEDVISNQQPYPLIWEKQFNTYVLNAHRHQILQVCTNGMELFVISGMK